MQYYDMYDEKIRVDLTDLRWTHGLWEKFMDQLCKKSYKVASGAMGEVLFLQDNARLSDYQIQTFVRSFVSDFLDRERAYIQEETGGSGHARLPITVHIESDTYLSYSTRLAALQMVPGIAEWILQYFINIKFIYREQSDEYFFFEEQIGKVLDECPCTYREVDEEGGIIAYLKRNLDNGRYVTVQLDEYYVRSKDYYQRAHHVEENLLYGYDDEQQLCYAFGFAKEQRATIFTMGYQELMAAYEKGKIFSFFDGGYADGKHSWPVLSYAPKEPLPYRISPGGFCDKLSEYLLPRNNRLLHNDLYVYGDNVVQEIIHNLRSDSLSGFMDYRAIHLLHEHKRALRRRMQMLEIRFWMPDYLPQLFLEFDHIIFAFQGIQTVYLKQSMQESRLWNYEKRVKERKVREKTADLLDRYSYEEQELLWKIKEGLSRL